ncbi:MAG TPA: ABC transporter permease [Thermodesulfobacteriota bacterium]|nr:ABC transporter permease [Thermodesulfobacteriota bacterium]
MRSIPHIFYLGVKELTSLRYDLVLLLFVIYAFTLDIVTATNLAVGVRNASIAIVDEDRTQLSTRIGEAFLKPRFKQPVYIEPDEINSGLNSGDYTFVLNIPPKFQTDVISGKQPEIQINVDATAVAQSFTGSVYIQQIITDEINAYMDKPAYTKPQEVKAAMRVKYNENMEERWYLSITELLIMITVLSMVMPAAALIREREHGTIEHLLVMPLRPGEIMLAKVWSNALVVQLGCLLCLFVVIEGYLDVPLRGSKFLFLLGTLVYQFTSTAIGMVLSTIVRTVQQLVLVILLAISPMIFLSGVFTPAESMPPVLSYMMIVSPLRYYVDFSLAVLFREAGISTVANDLFIMSVIGGVLFTLALIRFRIHFSMSGK